ncbi:MAG: hypothetical protein M9947_07215 [Thermomicrobiales bacterium]|nr:hypothetical protein [Thermomicrobiales bacterium]
MPRILLITAGLLLALCVVCVGLGYFIGIPRVQEGVEDGVDQAVATYIVPQIAGIGVTPEAGAYTLTEEDVNRQIQTGDVNLQDLRFIITPAGLELRFGEQGQDVAYTAQVAAVDGKIDIQEADLDGIPTWIIPTSAISKGLENGINTFLAEHNLVVSSVTMQDGSMTLVLEDAPVGAMLLAA